MAIVLALTDGTTSHDLVGSTYKARENSLDFGNPPTTIVNELQNALRHGWDLRSHSYGKRTIRMQLLVTASTLALYRDAIVDLNKALDDARAWARFGIGDRWYLNWDAGSGTAIRFTVRNGYFGLGAGDISATRLTASTPTTATGLLTLECDPIGYEADETLENYVPDPSFEVDGTDLADWTESKTATGTTERSTTTAKYGDASLKLVMTNSGGSGQVIERNVTLADVDAAEVWSFQAWVRIDALSNCKVVFEVDYTHGTDVTSESTTVDASGFVALTLNNNTVPGSTTAATIRCRLEATASSATGTVYFDGIMACLASAVPTGWISGKAIVNHCDDNGQAHINYADIHPEGGDIPALVQFKYSEDQAHDGFIAGIRHGARQYDDLGDLYIEGESFSGIATVSDGNSSGGNYGKFQPGVSYNSDFAQYYAIFGFTTLTGSFENAGGDILLVGMGSEDTVSVANPTGVTYGGVGLTKAAGGVSGANMESSIWYLVNPVVQTADIVATWAATVDEAAGMWAITVNGIDTDTPIRQTNTAGAPSGSTFTITLNSVVVGDFIYCVGGTATSSTTTVVNLTQLMDAGTRFKPVAGYLVADGTSETIGFTFASGGDFHQTAVGFRAGSGGTAAGPSVVTKAITTPATGSFRAYGRISNPDGVVWGVRMGWSYGNLSVDPSTASDYLVITAGQTGFQWHDLGAIVIPPDRPAENATVGTFTLRFALYQVSGAAGSELRLDAVMLLPLGDNGEEASIIEKTTGTDVVVVDSISDLRGTALWTAADVDAGRPQQTGTPFMIDPDGSRIFVLAHNTNDAPIDDGGSVSAVIRRRYLTVG